MSASDYELALRLQQELDREYSNAEQRERREVSSPEVGKWLQLSFALLFSFVLHTKL